MKTRFEPSMPSFYRAPFRRVNTQASGTPELVIPELKHEATSILTAACSHKPREDTGQNLQIIYERLGELGRTLLNNDPLFEFIRSFLTNPSNLDQFQRLVNAGLSAAVERGKYMPGGIQREEIRNEVVPIEIPFGEKIFEIGLDGFDIIFLEPDPIPYLALLVPTYTVKEKGSENKQCIKVGFDITPDNELVFTESIQVSEPEFGVGVAFIRPGDNDMKRTKAVWAMHKEMVSGN